MRSLFSYTVLSIAESSSHGTSGSPHFLIGIMAGLLSTLVILAFLIVVLLKWHTRRHPPPPMPTYETDSATGIGKILGTSEQHLLVVRLGQDKVFHNKSQFSAFVS